jgi:predicted RND superfamily exporter protein
MSAALLKLYERAILRHPLVSLLLTLLVIAAVAVFAGNFRLDASADSLVLENDRDLRYYRSIIARYGSDDFLVISYTPQRDLFAPATLADIKALSASLEQIERVNAVVSILNVPLVDSPRQSLGEMNNGVRTLETPGVDVQLAKREFLTSPLYSNLLVSPDAKTTALQVIFKRDQTYHRLLKQRNRLRELGLERELSAAEAAELDQATAAFDRHSAALSDQETRDIIRVRQILDQHRQAADLHLGGLPMIVSDMIDFIRHDLVSFGLGVLVFLIGLLTLIFRKLRWVLLPMLCCFGSVLFMFGFLGLVGWKVTVVSSNFTSLLLIITLSLCVHLIVQYNELFVEHPGADQLTLVREMVRAKAVPSIYTALTTIVAFVSLLISDIRPVIDFGWMMAIGISFALVISFLIFPAGLMLLQPTHFSPRHDLTSQITGRCARWVEHRSRLTLGLFVLLVIFSGLGISRLRVENRFIDNFKSSTEIYQGMELIDRQLGGTTPLDVIIDADPEFFSARTGQDETAEQDPFADFQEPQAEAGLSGSSYWYTSYRIDELQRIHDYLEQLPESGKVLSLATTMTLMGQVNNDQPLDNISLAVIHKKLPPLIQKTLFRPYLAEDGNQVRFSLRVFESNPNLRRNELLKKIRSDLTGELGLKDEQVHLTGMFVLYNNVLQSLFRSQIQTIGAVFLVIMGMFLLQFRSLRLAIIAIIPNLVSAGAVLGLMGWLDIPLDIMTITIAAITIGIAVDDTIHYIHRFREEIQRDGDYLAAMRRSHHSVGRAMFYTSITIIIGFSILALSNFIPTIYFGLFTGLAMAVAMIANLTLLALLLLLWRPRGAER